MTKDNADGGSRQSVIKRCRRHEQLNLHHDRKNRFDKNAMVVSRGDGSQLGFLNSELAGELVDTGKEGFFFTAYVSSLTGGELGKPTRGCNLLVIGFESSVPPEVVTTYAEYILAKDD